MDLIGKIKAKIHAGTFDGVPEDTQVTIFIPGVKHPLKAMLTDIEIEQPEPLPKPLAWGSNAWVVKNIEDNSIVAPGGWSVPTEMLLPVDVMKFTMTYDTGGFPSAGSGVSGHETLTALRKAIPGLSKIKTACPATPCNIAGAWGFTGYVSWQNGSAMLTDVIMHLNDHHHWSREQIADWLETKDWDLQFATPEGETA